MTTYIVLLRGVNVGGNNLLPMKPFVALLEQAGYQNVSSYIQSGNIVLSSDANPTDSINDIILKHYGFSPELFVLSEEAFNIALKNNPFHEHEGKCVHFYFCTDNISLHMDKLTKLIDPSEKYLVIKNIFYLCAPNGIGRSKLVSNIATCLGQSGTGRNLNTIKKISTMLINS